MWVRSNSSDEGFTLVEVLVAFAVLAVTLIALVNIFGTGFRGIEAAESKTLALRLAQSKLAEVSSNQQLQAGEQSGRFDDKYAWRLRVTPYVATGNSAGRRRLEANWVEVEVTWATSNHRRQRSVTLTTLQIQAPN